MGENRRSGESDDLMSAKRISRPVARRISIDFESKKKIRLFVGAPMFYTDSQKKTTLNAFLV